MKFRYCPRCRATLAEVTWRHNSCAKCGFDFYINPAATVSVIFTNDRREILLVRRKIPPKKGYWDLAGGFVEFNESAEECGRREMKEELGIRAGTLRYIGSYTDIYLCRGYQYHTFNFLFSAGAPNQELHPADDVSEARWFPVRKIPWSRLAFSWLGVALKDYEKNFTSHA